jgi:hypothetical protein
MNPTLDRCVRLGSCQLVFVQFLIWFVLTGFIAMRLLSHFDKGLGWIALLAFWFGLTFVVSQFTFGEADENGVRYWRPWGWQRLRWSEIEKFEDRFRISGVVATLRQDYGDGISTFAVIRCYSAKRRLIISGIWSIF